MKRYRSLPEIISALLCLVFLLAGCSSPLLRPSVQNDTQQTPFFLPPTRQSVLPSPSAGAVDNLPTIPQDCQDQLKFVSDLTINDGMVVSPDSTLDKRWEVENSGNCNWNEKYRIRLIAGPGLGARKEQALYPARSGTRAVIRLVFKAPLEPGAYRSAWQAFDPGGEPFGDPFFIDIVVQ